MFGIGSGELIILALVVLIAVGPKRLPEFMKTAGKVLREVRKATTELRKQSGIDEVMRDDPAGLRSLQRELNRAPAPRRTQRLTAEDLARESPADGVDLAHARLMAERTAAADALSSDGSSAVPDPPSTEALSSSSSSSSDPLPTEDEESA